MIVEIISSVVSILALGYVCYMLSKTVKLVEAHAKSESELNRTLFKLYMEKMND